MLVEERPRHHSLEGPAHLHGHLAEIQLQGGEDGTGRKQKPGGLSPGLLDRFMGIRAVAT